MGPAAAHEDGSVTIGRERLFDCSIDLLSIAGPDGRFCEVNPAWTKCLGWSREELTVRAWLDFVHPDDRERTTAALAQLLRDGELRGFENRYLCKEGGHRWLSWSSSLLSREGPIISVARDVTERVQAERQLRLVQSSIEHSIVPTFWLGRDARPRYVNEAAWRSLGYSREELMQLHVWDFDPGFSPERWAHHRGELVKAGSRVLETVHRRKDGTLFPVEISVHTVEFEGEQLSVSFVRDISQRKRDEEERAALLRREQAARAEAQEANRAKDSFLAVLSHELRNPLAAIVASLELLQQRLGDQGEKLAHVIEIAHRNAKLEARLLDDLLDLSRVVRGKVVLRRAPVALERVVHLAVESQQQDAVAAGIDLSLTAQPDLWVDADSDRLQQVVTNLLTNALSFTPAGGRILVSVEGCDGRGRVIVEDSGIGIEPARLSTIFDTMFQHGESGLRRKPGLGIGLALVKSIVEMHRGRTWAESEGHGRGSRFNVELPLVAAPSPRVVAEPTAPLAMERTLEVLLVEDNADTRELLSDNLRLLGYRVTAAASAEEALGLLAGARPDVILADIGLPGMDGCEFLRRARRMPEARAAPAFAITGFGQSGDLRRSCEAGFVEHFVKPVDLRVLDQQIRAQASDAIRRASTPDHVD